MFRFEEQFVRYPRRSEILRDRIVTKVFHRRLAETKFRYSDIPIFRCRKYRLGTEVGLFVSRIKSFQTLSVVSSRSPFTVFNFRAVEEKIFGRQVPVQNVHFYEGNNKPNRAEFVYFTRDPDPAC